MPQPISSASNSGFDEFDTLIPELVDKADVVEAFRLYHYGKENYITGEDPSDDSIYGHLKKLSLRPGGGGEVKTTQPTLTPNAQPIPDGYIWVDKDDISLTIPGFPTVLYSPTQPNNLGIEDVGTIWVNSDSGVDVLNLSDYQPITKYTSNAPSSPVVGQLWIDSDTKILNTYNGNSWETINGSGSVHFGNLEVSGRIDSSSLRETLSNLSIVSNTLTINFESTNIGIAANSPSANFTVNLTNVPTDNNKIITIVVMVTQGATGYIPNIFQIDGVAQTIKWQNNVAPTPTSSVGKVDFYNFTITRISSQWTVYGNSSSNF